MNTARQLALIYYEHEKWHKTLMHLEDAVDYHRERLNNGSIHVEKWNDEVVGYYERYFADDTCYLYNVYVKEGLRKSFIFRKLYKHFFDTIPENIKYIAGEKQRLGGKFQRVLISKERRHGKH